MENIMKKFVIIFSILFANFKVSAQTEIKLPFLKNKITITQIEGLVTDTAKFEWLENAIKPFGEDVYIYIGNIDDVINIVSNNINNIESENTKTFVKNNFTIIRDAIKGLYFLMPLKNSILEYTSSKNEFDDDYTYTLKVLTFYKYSDPIGYQHCVVLGVK